MYTYTISDYLGVKQPLTAVIGAFLFYLFSRQI